MNESNIIQFLQNSFPSPHGIGDDAAIFPLSETESYVITKDLLIENIHFRQRYFDATSLAHKALHVNLSDIAAMGATPLYALLGIAIPKTEEGYLNDFLHHFVKLCKTHKIHLIGGDTTGSPHDFFISITLIGRANNSHLKFRRNMKARDIICVAGNLGHAFLGLEALEKGIPGLTSFKEAALKPNARLAEGLWLGSQKAVTSLMDLSDGLWVDLKRLCEGSHLGAEIKVDHFNHTTEFLEACDILKQDPIQTALGGGEDYGLVFSTDPENYSNIASQFQETFGYALQKIGQAVETNGHAVSFTQHGHPITLNIKPFSHFGEL